MKKGFGRLYAAAAKESSAERARKLVTAAELLLLDEFGLADGIRFLEQAALHRNIRQKTKETV